MSAAVVHPWFLAVRLRPPLLAFGLFCVLPVVAGLRAEPPSSAPPSPAAPVTPLPLRAEATFYPRGTAPDLRIRFPVACVVTEAPNGAVLAAPVDSSFLMTVFPAPDAPDARTAASAAQELVGYLRLATKLEITPTEEIATVSGQPFYLVGAVGRDLLGKEIFYEVAAGSPEADSGFFYAVAAVYPTEAARRAHAAEFRASVRSICAAAGEAKAEPPPAATTSPSGPAKE